MKSRSFSPDPNPTRGFTLVELLVAVLIIIVLAGVVVSASKAAQRSAAKVSDMNNLRNLAVAAMASGGDNAGRLPTLHPDGQSAPYWLLSREILQTNGIYKESCYAPSRNIYGGAPKYDWWYNYGASTPTHYVYFANDAAVKTNAWFLKGKVTPPAKSEYRGALPYEIITQDPTQGVCPHRDRRRLVSGSVGRSLSRLHWHAKGCRDHAEWRGDGRECDVSRWPCRVRSRKR